MTGNDLNAGAGVTHVKSPSALAKEVMVNSPHVLLSGKGVSKLAKELGLEIVDPSYFYTERRFKSLQKIERKRKK